VLIADKMITLGDIVSDTSICKISRIGTTAWVAMVAGTVETADEILMRIERELQNGCAEDANEEYSMMKLTSRVYTEVYQERLEAATLTPKLLTRKTAYEREATLLPLSPKLVDEINEDRKRFEATWGCELLICGFDAKRRPKIFQIFQPGHAASETRQGYAAIGIGADAATGRLMWHESDCDDSLDRVLWETFDAKVQAEIMRGVGYSWDGYILLQSNLTKAESVPDELQEVMDKAVRPFLRSPFSSEPIDPSDALPEDWKEQITQFTKSLLEDKIENNEDGGKGAA
jgi:20S proteasome alpha/beta subunit